MLMDVMLADLGRKALAVAAMKKSCDEAFAEEHDVEAAVLGTVIRLVMPKLREDVVLVDEALVDEAKSRLLLRKDGSLAEDVCREDGSAPGMVDLRDVVGRYDLTKCLAAIHDALKQQLDGDASEAARHLIERLAAIVTMMHAIDDGSRRRR